MLLLVVSITGTALLTACNNTNSETGNQEMQQSDYEQAPALNSSQDTNPNVPTTNGDLTTDDLTNPNLAGIDMVPSNSLIENARSNPELSIFIGAVHQAGLLQKISGTGPYTLFAPSNEAFEALPGNTVNDLMKPENKQQLTELVNNHIVAGKLHAKALQTGSTIKTAGNGQVKATNNGSNVMVNGAHVSTADIVSSNGVIHIIDKVLMPDKE